MVRLAIGYAWPCMGWADGWAALHLEMPPRVPRTEYSTELHFPLIEAVTHRAELAHAGHEERWQAFREFSEAWDFSLLWLTLIDAGEFGDLRTRMGHAEYMADMADYDANRSQAFADVGEVLAFQPKDRLPEVGHDEMVRRFDRHYRANCQALPDTVNMTGIYVTCVSGLIDLFGWELLLEAIGEDPLRMGRLTNEYCDWISCYFAALADSVAPVVMVHDDLVWTSGPIFDPVWYREFVFPNYRKLIAPLVEAGKRVIFTADGNYTAFVDDIAESGVHGFVMEPTTDMALVAERYGRTHFFVGNADTRILLSGSPAAIESEVLRCMEIGKVCPGFVMAVGNHIPPNTPVESALHYDACYKAMRER